MELLKNRSSHLFLLAVIALLFTWISIRTFHHGDDFEVFWQASRALFRGEPIYSVQIFGNMVFKYPPWILPAFLPFAIFPLAAAKLLWGVTQGLCMVQVVHFLRKRDVRSWLIALLLLAFGGILLVHALVGQVTLLLLSGFLVYRGFFLSDEPRRTGPVSFAVLVWLSTLKIYTVFPLLGLQWKKLKISHFASAFLALSFLSVPVWALSYDFSLQMMLSDWANAVFSGTQGVASKRIGFATRELQGLPPLLVRLFEVSESNRSALTAIQLGTFAGLGGLFLAADRLFLRRRIGEFGVFMGWLALTPIVQPLSWFHFFWMAFPLLACAAEGALREGQRGALAMVVLSVLMVAAITSKTLGMTGLWLEMASVKMWGVFLVLSVWILKERIANQFRRC